MGEEEKKGEEGKKREGEKPKVAAPAEGEKPKAEEEKPKIAEEKKAKEGGGGGGGGEAEKKEGREGDGAAAPPPPPPPPEEIVMRVYMHCEGCARKVRRCLKGFEGVEDVITDCRAHKVVVKGRKAAEDPMKVVERVQRKSGRKVELLTPLPPPKPEKKEEEKKEEENSKPEEKKEEPPVIAVVLKVHMHCEACAQEIEKRILKMKGVQAAEPDLKASQVTVKGVFDPPKLVEYVYKRTGKHAAVIKVEPVDKKTEEAKPKEEAKDEKKPEGENKDKAEGGEKEKKEGNDGGGDGEEEKKKDEAAAEDAAAMVVELKRNEFLYQYQYHYPRYPVNPVEYYVYPPGPGLFSDENPNACSVM